MSRYQNMKLGQLLKKVIYLSKGVLEEKKYQKIASGYDMRGFKRIYLVHIRKTGGTSLTNMFLSLSGEDPVSLYEQLASTPDNRIIINGIIYVGWRIRYINSGNYFYGFSHTPLHKLDLPSDTFTITCFRDPVKRVISHYNMLMNFQVNNISHECMRIEGKWLGTNFYDFLKRIPKNHLLNQLYMFSRQYDIDEAVAEVGKLSHYFFTENFSDGVNELNEKTGLSLEPIHIRNTRYNAQIPEEGISMLREMLDKEYIFLKRIQTLQST